MDEQFWLKNPSIIYKNYSVKIKKNMTINELFNTLTRIIIIIFIVLLIYFCDISILIILFVVLLVIIVIYYTLNYVNIQETHKEHFTNNIQQNTNDIQQNLQNNEISTLGSEFSSIMTLNDDYSNLISDNVHEFNADSDSLNNDININNINKMQKDMYNTVDEIFEKKNIERNFKTQQNYNIPSGQGEAIKWIYALPSTCKEYTGVCKEYDDLSRKRNPIY